MSGEKRTFRQPIAVLEGLDVAGGSLKLAGVAIAATAAELNGIADVSAAAIARTATAAGDGTGLIADAGLIQFIQVTSGNADHIITLPTPNPGAIVILNVAANGFELRSNAPTTVLINGGTGGAAVESAIAANSTCIMICVTATAWKGFFLDADSDLAKVEAAAT